MQQAWKVSHDLARGYTGAVWQRLPTTGHALNIFSRAELSIFDSFTINKLDASGEYRKIYMEDFEKYRNTKPDVGYKWLYDRRWAKRKSKLITLHRFPNLKITVGSKGSNK